MEVLAALMPGDARLHCSTTAWLYSASEDEETCLQPTWAACSSKSGKE